MTTYGPRLVPDVSSKPTGDAAVDYQQRHGWPAVTDPTTGAADLVLGGTVDALVMPASLGKAVYAFLSIRMLAGPVVIDPRHPERWVFLTEPGTGATKQTLADLAALEVELPQPGMRLPLPADRPGPGMVRWLDEPAPGRALPPWHAVSSAARSVVASQQLAA